MYNYPRLFENGSFATKLRLKSSATKRLVLSESLLSATDIDAQGSRCLPIPCTFMSTTSLGLSILESTAGCGCIQLPTYTAISYGHSGLTTAIEATRAHPAKALLFDFLLPLPGLHRSLPPQTHRTWLPRQRIRRVLILPIALAKSRRRLNSTPEKLAVAMKYTMAGGVLFIFGRAGPGHVQCGGDVRVPRSG
jgi:hypothetical protein